MLVSGGMATVSAPLPYCSKRDGSSSDSNRCMGAKLAGLNGASIFGQYVGGLCTHHRGG